MQKTLINAVYRLSLTFLSIIFFSFFIKTDVHADEPYIIVIDPGHGGENLGAEYDGYTEKDMTMKVAFAMKEELERYENVIVYLTHETDIDMTIKDRALFARKKQADFLFSLHFNASVNHNLFGAEVWVPAYDDYYVLGRQFAEIEMELLTQEGLYSRGIKTKLNNNDNDYYGILRYCTQEGIPSALIEHCHMDHPIDMSFFQSNDEQLSHFGKLDAQAVAKFLGLSSKELSVDYSEYPLPDVAKPEKGVPVRPDQTPPEICESEVLSINEETAEITVRIKASDTDNYIQYYSYSIDGGQTYSSLQKWPRPFWNHSDEEYIFTISVPFEQENKLIVKVYNGFDGFAESNVITLEPVSGPKSEETITPVYEEISVETISYNEEKKLFSLQLSDKLQLIMLILIISLLMTWIFFIMIKMINMLKADNKRYRGRK